MLEPDFCPSPVKSRVLVDRPEHKSLGLSQPVSRMDFEASSKLSASVAKRLGLGVGILLASPGNALQNPTTVPSF